MSIDLKVDPQDLVQKANRVSELIQKLKGEYQDVEERMKSSISYWEGLAGDEARSSFAEADEQLKEVFRRLEEHPTDLMKMAGVYKKTENDLEQLNDQLAADVII